VIDVLIGPAGAGKTTTLNALRTAWEQEHGAGSVVGLAPSATAAAMLGQDLGIPTENTSKWLADHQRTGQTFTPGQLVIIDEASLSGTNTLGKITALAARAGAKVLLVGDPHQLQAVEAGGAFTLIATSRDDAPQLSEIHRFHHVWEKAASLELRLGNPGVIDTYAAHGRIREGDTDAMLQAAYQAWLADVQAGRQSVLIADDRNTVAELNVLFADDAHVGGEVTWHVYQQAVAAYCSIDKARGAKMLNRLITAISHNVPPPLIGVRKLGHTLSRRRVDIMAYFDHPGTSNDPTEAINGRLEHLRGSALGFRNLTNYIARSLLETGGFRPVLHSRL